MYTYLLSFSVLGMFGLSKPVYSLCLGVVQARVVPFERYARSRWERYDDFKRLVIVWFNVGTQEDAPRLPVHIPYSATSRVHRCSPACLGKVLKRPQRTPAEMSQMRAQKMEARIRLGMIVCELVFIPDSIFKACCLGCLKGFPSQFRYP